ncbi:13477_t:CDS:2 [Entrophospora sp. SA101]|nr:13477_t:CDS:2 [Entrophospora sp. SA101]
MPPQKKLRKHLKKISSIGVASCRLKKKYNKDLPKSQVIEILKSMSSNELHEIIHEISSNEFQEIFHSNGSQEIICEMNSDELQETIHEINFDEPQETIHEINSNEFQEIIHSNVSQEIICEMNSDELQETIHEINFDEPQETIHKINTLIPQNKIEKRRNELIEHVKNLPESQIINAYTLFSTMTYDKGNHRGEIYSSYIQKKAKEFVNSSIYKQSSSMSSIQEKISEMETKIHKIEKEKENTDLQLRSLKMKEVKAKETKKNHVSKLQTFYEKVFKFLTGFDTVLRIANEDETKCLPLGNRAHEMPDQVFIWIDELEKAAENPELIFKEEFENAQWYAVVIFIFAFIPP